MKLWFEYHGLGLALIVLALAAAGLGVWFPVGNIMAGGLLLVGIVRACEGHAAYQDLLRARRRERGEPC